MNKLVEVNLIFLLMAITNKIAKAQSIDEYLSVFPVQTQKLLQQMRITIHRAAPKAQEVISYGMPAFALNGVLVYFAGYKSHIGFYPTGKGIAAFKKEIAPYKNSKGAVQFPLDKPLPLDLIKKMVKFRVEQNLLNAKTKQKRTTAATRSSVKQEKGFVKYDKNETVEKSDSISVTAFIKKLDQPLANSVQAIREIILKSDKQVGERIKWNHPSFFYTGKMKPFDPKEYKREIAVFNLHKNRIMLVLPSGAKIQDAKGLLEGEYKDGRRLIIFKDLKDISSKKVALKSCIKSWISLVDK